MQQQLFAGTTLNFLTPTPGYSAAEGWVLKFRLVPRTSGAAIDITCTAEGEDHRAQVTAAATAAWALGSYTWTSRVEKSGEIYAVGQGQISIQQNPATALAGFDGRSQAARALDDARAALASFNASNGRVRRYRIGERETEYHSAAEIIKQIAYWEQELEREENAARLATGRPARNRMYAIFTR